MPATAVQKPPPISKKPPLHASNMDSKDLMKDCDGKFNGKDTSHNFNAKSKILMDGDDGEGEGGAGETVTKKPVKKAKTDDERNGKKVNGSVNERPPKKNAQRTKGSTSLNKALDKSNSESLEKTKAASGDKVPAKEEAGEKPKTKSDSRKASSDAAEKKTKTACKKASNKGMKTQPKNWPKIPSEETTSVETVEKPPEVVVAASEPQDTTGASHTSSCSFLERLQLGVKAYFNSRNSFICSDKNKKEGGNQTRARVGKGVKEDTQKTDPGFELKNKIYISESDLLFNQLRLISNLGGQSSNFLTDKPKTLQNLKSKKSYNPKKHCVRIQIPRKGYFYRSSMQFKTPGSPSSGPLQLLEPSPEPKIKSKVQISRMAPTGSEVAHIPVKKRVKKKRKPSEEAGGHVHSDAESFDSLSCGISDRSTWAPRLLAECDFGETTLGSAETVKKKRWSGKGVSFSGDLFPESVNPEREGERQGSSISENSFSAEDQKKKKKNTTGVGGDCLEVLERSSTKPRLPRKKPTKSSSSQSWSTFQALTKRITSILKEDDLMNNLEITPVSTKSEMYTSVQDVEEEPKEQSANASSIESGALFMTPLSSTVSEESNNETWGNPTAMLMGDIDLHLELQNYLKAFGNVSPSKTRTKNTLHSNSAIKRENNSNESVRTQTGELFGSEENGLGLTFGTSNPVRMEEEGGANGCFLDELEEDRVESRLPRSQTQLTDILNLMRKVKSEEEDTVEEKQSFEQTLTEELSDGYEKILPFEYTSSKGSVSHESRAFVPSQTHVGTPTVSLISVVLSEKEKPLACSLSMQDLIEVYRTILKENKKCRSKKSPSEFSSHLFSLLNEKLQQKHNKTNLKNCSKEFTQTKKALGPLKGSKRKNKPTVLQEYVSTFQQILKSPMTIKEIRRLNGIMSGSVSFSEENIKHKKNATGTDRRKRKRRKVAKPQTQQQQQQQQQRPTTSRGATTNSNPTSKPSSKKQRRSPPTPVKKKQEVVSPPAKTLQPALESFFNSKGEHLESLSRLKGKILVDVQLSGNEIRVNDLSFLKKENVLPDKKLETDGTSELIIESMNKSQEKGSGKTGEARGVKRNVKKQVRVKKGKRTPPKSPKCDKPKETAKKLPVNCTRKQSKPPLQFEYNEMQLRAQHPIDPIAERSEVTISDQYLDEKSEKDASETEIPKSFPVDTDLLKKVLENQFYLEELMSKYKWDDAVGKALNRTKSYEMKSPPNQQQQQQQPPAVSQNSLKPPHATKSLVDLKLDSNSWKKAHKTSASSLWPRNSFFCYSYTQILPQNDSLETGKKGKKKAQKTQQEFELKRQKSDANIFKPKTPRQNASKMEEALTGSVWYSNGVDLPDCCSIELLFAESKYPGGKSNRRKSPAEPPMTLPESDNRRKGSNTSVVLHPFNSFLDDRSFSLDLIHSDSFLNCFSQSSILERDTRTLLKNNSDIKIHPERVSDSRRDLNPFVTFVLSPEQFEVADLPSEVMVVKKTRVPNVSLSEEPSEEDKELNSELGLDSIESFINFMAKSTKAPEKKKNKSKSKNKIKKEQGKVFSFLRNGRKPKTRCQTCQFLSCKESQEKPGKTFGTKEKTKKAGVRPKSGKSQFREVRSRARSESPKPFPNRDPIVRVVRSVSRSDIELVEEEPETEVSKMGEENATQSEARKTEEGAKMSINFEHIPLELLEALKIVLTHAESFKKEKITSATEEEIDERTQTDEKRTDNCTRPSRDVSPKKEERPKNMEEKSQQTKPELLDSLLVKETDAKELEEKHSIYFDALEWIFKDDIGGEMNGSVNITKTGTIGLNLELGVNEKSKTALEPFTRGRFPLLTKSDAELLSQDPLEEKSEELILNKISKFLIEGQISYSLLLLEYFLEKTENSASKKGKSTKLKKLLRLVEEKTPKVMTSLERSAWLKVLVVLNELSELLVEKGVEQSLKARLQSTKFFVQDILEMNMSRMDELKEFNLSVSEPPSEGKKENGDKNVFGVITECLEHFRKKFGVRKNPVVNPPEVRQKLEEKVNTEEMVKYNRNEPVLSEIRDMKNKVVKELMSLEKTFLVSEWSRSSSSWEEATSLSKNNSWRESGGTSREGRLSRSSGYMHIMQCLMKVWDTRMSLNTYSSDCFG